MIFRPIRISELEKDLDMKREAFRVSRDELIQIGKIKLNPLYLLKHDPKSLFGFGSVVAILGSLFLFLGKFLGLNKKGPLWGFVKMGWALGLVNWSARNLIKFFLPLTVLGIKKWRASHLKKTDLKPE